MNLEQRTALLSLVPPEYHHIGRVFVAGGYAADAEKAADIDLWVLTTNPTPILRFAESTWEGNVNVTGFELAGEGGEYDEQPVLDEEVADSLFHRGVTFIGRAVLKQFNTAQQRTMTVQLLTFAVPSVEKLLADFDISVHQVAIDVVEGSRHTSPTTTSALTLPRVVRWTTPKSTFKRLGKLLDRYGFPSIGHPDSARLLALASGAPEVSPEVDNVAA